MRKNRKVQASVTNFIHCGDEYLFLHRAAHKKTDPNRLNGVGGKLEVGENYLQCAIRETKEETGYIVQPSDLTLAGVVQLEGGYPEDWIMCFFKIKVSTTNIPLGKETSDGTLLWLHKDEVLTSPYELVDDLRYCFEEIVREDELFFIQATLGDDQKIIQKSISKIPIRI